jgi:integrase
MGNPFNGFDAPFHDERDSRYTPILRKDDCYLPAPFRVVDAPAVRQTRQEVDEAPSYKLKQTVDKFIHEKISSNHWQKKSQASYIGHYKLLVEHFGEDMNVDSITRDRYIDFRNNILKKLPSSRTKKYEELSLQDALKLKDVPIISDTTVNNIIRNHATFFIWCEDNGYISHIPTKNTKLKLGVRPHQERKEFSKEDLKKILTEIAKLPKNQQLNIDRYWITLTGLLQGMRMNEICQLYTCNIITKDNVLCFDIKPDAKMGQRVKNQSAIRTIPINPLLLELGFEDYLKEAMDQEHGQLFPTLTFGEHNGYIKNYSNWFTNFRREKVTEDPKKNFHSFRHSFISNLANRGVATFVVGSLSGQKNEGETLGRYSKPNILAMLKGIQQLDYGIDIPRLLDKKSSSKKKGIVTIRSNT